VLYEKLPHYVCCSKFPHTRNQWQRGGGGGNVGVFSRFHVSRPGERVRVCTKLPFTLLFRLISRCGPMTDVILSCVFSYHIHTFPDWVRAECVRGSYHFTFAFRFTTGGE